MTAPLVCPYCKSDDLVSSQSPNVPLTLTVCVPCGARAINGQWASPQEIAAYRRAQGWTR